MFLLVESFGAGDRWVTNTFSHEEREVHEGFGIQSLKPFSNFVLSFENWV
jgi:hypothetical protein